MKKLIQLIVMLGFSSALCMAKDHVLRLERPYMILKESKLTKEELKRERRRDLVIAAWGIFFGTVALADAIDKTAEIHRESFEKHLTALNNDFGNLNA